MSSALTPGASTPNSHALDVAIQRAPIMKSDNSNNVDQTSSSPFTFTGVKNKLMSITKNPNGSQNFFSFFTAKFIFWYLFLVCIGGVLLLLITPAETMAPLSSYAGVMFILFFVGYIISNYYLNPKNITYSDFITSIKDGYEKNKFFFMNAYLVIFFMIFAIFTLSILYHTDSSATDQTNVIVKKYDYLILPSLFLIGMLLAILAFRKEKINNATYVQNYYGFLYITFLVFLCALYFYDTSQNSYLTTTVGSLFKANVIIAILLAIYLVIMYIIIQYGKYNKGATYDAAGKPIIFFKYAGPLLTIFIFISAIALYVKKNEYKAYLDTVKDKKDEDKKYNKETAVGLFLAFGILIFMVQGFLVVNNEKAQNPIGLAAKTSNILESQLVFFFKLAFAFLIFVLSIVWFINSLNEIKTKKLGVFQFLVNIVILVFIFMLFLRYMVFNEQTRETKLYRFFYALVMVVPCTIRDIVQYFWRQYNSQFIGFVLVMIIVFICAVKFQSIKQFILNQNGTLYIESPIPLDHVNTISMQSFANTSFPYNYAISMWIWIDSFNKTNSSTDCISIVNYYNYPNMCFSPTDDTLKFLFANTNIQIQIPLARQKWNHVVINSDSINVDVFLNGHLNTTNSLSSFQHPPYSAIIESNFTTGQENGVSGKICNMNYYTSILSISQIQFLYTTVSTFNPPVILNTGTTLKNMF